MEILTLIDQIEHEIVPKTRTKLEKVTDEVEARLFKTELIEQIQNLIKENTTSE